jgi:hypothetical protein
MGSEGTSAALLPSFFAHFWSRWRGQKNCFVLCINIHFFLWFFFNLSPTFSSRLGRRQLRARPGSGRHPAVDAVEAQGDGVVPLSGLNQGRVEGREQILRRRRHEDAADARRGEAVGREQRVERPLAALEEEAPRQQRPLLVGGRGGEQLLVPEHDAHALGEVEGPRDRAECSLVGEFQGTPQAASS